MDAWATYKLLIREISPIDRKGDAGLDRCIINMISPLRRRSGRKRALLRSEVECVILDDEMGPDRTWTAKRPFFYGLSGFAAMVDNIGVLRSL